MNNFRFILWKVLHPLYESKYTRKGIVKIVNAFKPDSVVVGPHKMFIDKEDRVISAELILSGKWEEYESNLFEKSIQPGDTVLDIGAHIGYYTLIAARKVGPKGKVYAFEPLTKNFNLLKKNVEANGYTNVELINAAVSNKVGIAKLFLSNEDNYGDQRIYDSEESRKTLRINTTTLDKYFSNRKGVNVVKMDIQGSEMLALKGAIQLFKRSRKLKVFTEFWPKALRQAGSSATEYLNLLKRYRLELYEVSNEKASVKKVSPKTLLGRYPETSMFNADLMCIKE